MPETPSLLSRRRLERAGSLHWLHAVVVGLSVLLTLGAWHVSREQVEERKRRQFERECEQVLGMVRERMQKYEDALWGGVALIDTLGRDVRHGEWLRFTETLDIETKYPGINGLGVIFRVERGELDAFLDGQRVGRPGFRVHPEHGEHTLYPITFIEPVADNQQAVGLDMAHEENRHAAVRAARDTGRATITGPIVLVQDEARSPGFLFFVPFYGDALDPTEGGALRGVVYAPFVVRKLMEGVLHKENRHVGVRITDGDEVLYDEHLSEEPDHDPEPLHRTRQRLELYGRSWEFDLRSTRSFRSAQGSAQPLTILLSGLTIDALLLWIFLGLSRANRRALQYADDANRELTEKAADLERSNEDLARFAYVASHDLQEPLRMVGSFAELLDEEYRAGLDEQGRRWLAFLVDGAHRMQALVRDLLTYSRVGRHEYSFGPVDADRLLHGVLGDLAGAVEEAGAVLRCEPLPTLWGDEAQLRLVLQNLVSNALKFRDPGRRAVVQVRAVPAQGEGRVMLEVEDSGIGIEQRYADRVFAIFQRLHTHDAYRGTGLGLAIAKKIVEDHGGSISFRSEPGRGTTFRVELRTPPRGPSLARTRHRRPARRSA